MILIFNQKRFIRKMSKNKKTHKVLVRNPSVPFQSRKVSEKSENLKKVHFGEDVFSGTCKSTFSAPEFCTVLQLASEIEAVRNAQGSSRSLPEISKYKNLNFLPEERMYHDLVNLDVPEEAFVNEVRSQPCVKLKKDPELEISKYINQDLEPEYVFTSNAVTLVKKPKNAFNGHSIYNSMVMWKECAN